MTRARHRAFIAPRLLGSLAAFAVFPAYLAMRGAPSALEVGALETARGVLASWIPPLLLVVIALFGFSRRVKVYESVVQGAREGFQIAVMIIPFLVAILVSVGMFRASGALDVLIGWLSPVTSQVGFPAEALPMALIRPLSGSGARGSSSAAASGMSGMTAPR